MTFASSRLRAGVIALISVAAAIAGGMQGLANTLASRAPGVAMTLSGSSPVAVSKLTRAAIKVEPESGGPNAVNLSAANPLAQETLSRSLLSPLALGILAWDEPRARRTALLTAGSHISRRDTLLLGLLVQHYTEIGDNGAALRTITQLMRVSQGAESQLIAEMVTMLADDEAASELARVLADDPPWIDAFFEAGARRPEFAENLSRIRLSLPMNTGISRETDRAVVESMIANGQLDAALMLYNASAQDSSGVAGQLNSRIDWADEDPPFDWELVDSYAAFLRPETRRSAMLRVRPGQTLVLGERLVQLPAEATGIRVRHDINLSQGRADVTIGLTCVQTGELIGERSFGQSPFVLRILGAADSCRVAKLTITASVWSTGDEIEGQIDALEFVRGDK